MVFPRVDSPHLDFPCVDIPHVEGRRNRNMASPSKAAYSERKRQKSTFILTVNSPVYPPIQGKENRLFLRPFIAAKETGGLDFLIAHALLIVCHSLFEVVIEILSEAPLSAVRSRWRWNALSARTEA